MLQTETAQSAIDQWVAHLGTSNIVLPGPELDQLLQNTTHYEAPMVLALLKPQNTAQLAQILAVANTWKTPVYTYSRGFNWGLGSKLPVQNGCALVELSALNSILEINEQFHYAIVEPGVSQAQLVKAIEDKGLSVMLNVTGSAPITSVLANMLERGSGFMEHRINDLRGMEVMLADGSLVKSGFWHLPESSREIHHYRFGLGADWQGLFSQSNLGIVTKAVVNLYPKKEVQKMLWCKVDQTQLPHFVEITADLYQRRYLYSITHIGNDKRMKIENRNPGNSTIWTSMAMVQGSESFVKFLENEIPTLLAGQVQSMGFMNKEEADAMGIGPIYGCHVGQPTDYFMKAMYQSVGDHLDREDLQIDLGRYGMLCCLPVIPAKAADIQGAVEILDSIDRDFGIIPAGTLNPINDLYLEAVINIYFDRTQPEAVAAAHKANLEMHRRFYEDGYRFYRFDVKTMQEYLDPSDPHWQLVHRLKECLDPHGILSPGRYEIGSRS